MSPFIQSLKCIRHHYKDRIKTLFMEVELMVLKDRGCLKNWISHYLNENMLPSASVFFQYSRNY